MPPKLPPNPTPKEVPPDWMIEEIEKERKRKEREDEERRRIPFYPPGSPMEPLPEKTDKPDNERGIEIIDL